MRRCTEPDNLVRLLIDPSACIKEEINNCVKSYLNIHPTIVIQAQVIVNTLGDFKESNKELPF
jgi:hypothetical protein